jgi:putative endonuclease
VEKKGRNQRIGNWGEKLAEEFLKVRGYQILGKNVRTSYGELDIIASCDSHLAFVEVKARRSAALGKPEIAVNGKKRLHLIQSAESYLQQHPELVDTDWQIDVIAISKYPGQIDPEILWFENAVS